MIHHGRDIKDQRTVQCDVCIVGSGAGGGTAAMVLAEAGYKVVVLEAGGAYTRERFTMQERDVYPLLYQEGMRRATADLGISILQGRVLGGGTVVNWTTCFRTPKHVLDHWASRFGLTDLTEEALNPHWATMEGRLGVHGIPEDQINANNKVLWDGCKALGWERATLRRNTRGCRRSGYCGLGCPVDAKQSMALTGLQDALGGKADIFADCHVDRLTSDGAKITRIEARFHHPEQGDQPTGGRLIVEPQVAILSGGAINSPAVLLRSEIGDQSGMVGKRTFLHPVVAITGAHKTPIHPYYGIPQSVSSHHFAQRKGIGFFLEAAPLHPVLLASALPGHASLHREGMARLSHTNSGLALMIDGFGEDEPGGTVSLHGDGAPKLDYVYTERLWEGVQAGLDALCRVALAGGATEVHTGHEEPLCITAVEQLNQLKTKEYAPNKVRLFSAHQMGGCMMGGDPESSVVNAELRHHHIENLYVMDGSVFPTSLGVNPQLSIYGLVHRAATRLAGRLSGADNG